ncbi:hypothetical protein [Spiroplasma poulsonii]|uniref:hypothetical protein n=1 Tax=Spiroplasma poulsonii TaxID=2138 RepID=UPI001F4CBFB8|nr:hypothetical protein [Spiroplasma poulsonii]UNF61611.1 hypothetical protein MNU24_06785 [Spiroplasma poulsonii]
MKLKNFLIERDNEIFKIHNQQGKILQGYKVVLKNTKTIKQKMEWQGFWTNFIE